MQIKRLLVLLLVLLFMLATMCACYDDSSDDQSRKHSSRGNSSSSYLGQYDLKNIYLNGKSYSLEDITEKGWHDDQYVILRKDGTATLALSAYSATDPLTVLDVLYTYDADDYSGYFYTKDSSDRISFTLKNKKLVFEAIGATFTFKK